MQAAVQAGVLDKVMPMLWSEEGLELTACLMLLHVLVAKLPQEQAELRLQAMLGAGFIIRIFTILQQVSPLLLLLLLLLLGARVDLIGAQAALGPCILCSKLIAGPEHDCYQ